MRSFTNLLILKKFIPKRVYPFGNNENSLIVSTGCKYGMRQWKIKHCVIGLKGWSALPFRVK